MRINHIFFFKTISAYLTFIIIVNNNEKLSFPNDVNAVLKLVFLQHWILLEADIGLNLVFAHNVNPSGTNAVALRNAINNFEDYLDHELGENIRRREFTDCSEHLQILKMDSLEYCLYFIKINMKDLPENSKGKLCFSNILT